MQVDLPIILSLLLLFQMKSGKKRNLLRVSVLALALGSEYIGVRQSKSRLLLADVRNMSIRTKQTHEANQLFEVVKSRQL